MKTSSLPYVTADLPGTGGRVRTRVEDFVVEEVPAYEPSGVGDHLYLLIEKCGIPTHAAVKRVARALQKMPRDIGYAGLKDARAVTRQTLSVERVDEAAAREALAEVPDLRLLSCARYGNKLRLGHLRGNRFRIVVRGVTDDADKRARAVLDVLVARGAPNWFGEQRFGAHGGNDAVGKALVQKKHVRAIREMLRNAAAETDSVLAAFDAEDFAAAESLLPSRRREERELLARLANGQPPHVALRAVPRRVLRLLVSAYQSALFNRLAAARAEDLGRLEEGDLAYLHDRGAAFTVENVAPEQARADALEISPSAPLFGTRSSLASGGPGERERALLAEEGLALADFKVPLAGEMRGERRAVRVPITDVAVGSESGDGEHVLDLAFTLPRGSFATAVLREVMKGKSETE